MRTLLIICFSIAFVGCGGSQYSDTSKLRKSVDSSASMGWENSVAEAPAKSDAVDSDIKTGSEKSSQRKIIYTAAMSIVVEQFDGLESKVSNLVKQNGGFIASANLGRMTGQRREGTWVIRIPVVNYESFLNAAGDIGVPESRNESASDVTEEFVDIGARIENKKKLETRILELLKRPDDKIQHVIEVEQELARVREEIERMEGRLRYLADATSMTTIRLNVREETNYVPAQALTLTSRINNAWSSSLTNCRIFFENAIVFVVGNVIGFALFLVFVLIAYFVLKRIWGRVYSPGTTA